MDFSRAERQKKVAEREESIALRRILFHKDFLKSLNIRTIKLMSEKFAELKYEFSNDDYPIRRFTKSRSSKNQLVRESPRRSIHQFRRRALRQCGKPNACEHVWFDSHKQAIQRRISGAFGVNEQDSRFAVKFEPRSNACSIHRSVGNPSASAPPTSADINRARRAGDKPDGWPRCKSLLA